ncbi:patched domain-containing protein 3-like [Centruroides sculpturatus]|uniref:patched domain-containing protein 3-like n=1 Tax=Centruroides sculpturatus TaxID=218467 RepID=UPI000C6EB787|nr:patched domain-containing protein 3-like [Centruroides sculpturatus]
MKYDYINRYVSLFFGKMGCSVGKHPLLYSLTPLLIIGILSTGFYKTKILNDTEDLYSPKNGRAIESRTIVEKLFPVNMSNMEFSRSTRLGRLGFILFEEKSHKTMLKEYILKEITYVHNVVQNISVTWNNRIYKYLDLCRKNMDGTCYNNNALSLRGKIRKIRKKLLKIRYPVDIHEATMNAVFYAYGLGKVSTDEDGYIKNVGAVRLIYLLNYQDEDKKILNLKWEEKFIDTVSQIKCDHLNIYFFASSSLDVEVNKITELVLPLLPVTIAIMVIFSVVTCMTTDWVTSKPWIGIAGCINPLLGVIGAFGLLLWTGMEFIDINVSIPFILLGVGLDNSFVLLAAWRRTDPKMSVTERMSITYSEAAVSITITSLTNFLSFCIGMTTSYKIIQIYSVYISLAIIFCYFCEITFFGGILAISGYRESKCLHSVFCIPVKRGKLPDIPLLKLLYVGLVKETDEFHNGSNILVFCRDTLGKILTKTWVKIIIIILTLIYCACGIYCLRFIKQGMKKNDFYPFHSYANKFVHKHYELFTEYSHVIQVVINKKLDYSDKNVQKNVLEIMNKFSNAKFMAGEQLVDFWLKYYIQSFNDKRLWFSYRGYNMSKSDDFTDGLRDIFLKFPFSRRFKQDILFDKNKTDIIASRFIVVAKNISNPELERQLLLSLWALADSCIYPVYVHNFWFTIIQQYVYIEETTIHTLCIVAVLIIIMFFLFVPNIICIVCIAITTVLIQIGIIGFMSIWSVNLNTVSMLCLFMATGLSVDYTFHASYIYITSKKDNPNEKIKETLYATGYPIFQGCISTILGVVVIVFPAAEAFKIFFKIILLTMILAFLYGIFVIPVFLNVWETIWKILKERKHKNEHVECNEMK